MLAITENSALAIEAQDQQQLMHMEEQTADEAEGNTFITNIGADSHSPKFATQVTQPENGLPEIGPKQKSNNAKTPMQFSQRTKGQTTTAETLNSTRRLNSIYVKTSTHGNSDKNDYQLMPVIEGSQKIMNGSSELDCRNTQGSLSMQRTADRKSMNTNSVSTFTPSRPLPKNVDIVAVTSEWHAQEPSDLASSNAKSIHAPQKN